MQNLSENELDDLFRKAAAHGGKPYDPADWETLRKRLDNAQPPRAWATWKIPGFIILLVITSSIMIGYYINVVTTTSNDIAAENRIDESTPAAPNITDLTTATDNRPERGERRTLPNTGNATIAEEDTGATENRSLQQLPLTSMKPSTSGRQDHTVYPLNGTTDTRDDAIVLYKQKQPLTLKQRANENVSQDERVRNTPAVDEGLHEHQRSVSSELQSVVLADSAADTRLPAANRGTHITTTMAQHNASSKPTTPAAADDRPVARKPQQHPKGAEIATLSDSTTVMVNPTPTLVKKPDSVNTANVETPKEKASKNLYKLALKLAVSPDYSSVRFTALGSTGTNFGVLVEYQVTPHWSIVTGGISARKIYSATDVEYDGYRVDRADGDCRILDIPINVSYVFKPDRNLSFYTSVGFSTYIMNKEDYVFHVDSGYGSTSYSKNVRGQNNEFFSIVNVSAGVQKKITDRWAVQLEPFVKVPVKGIGEGNLSLNTLGAFFHLKYSFYNRHNP